MKKLEMVGKETWKKDKEKKVHTFNQDGTLLLYPVAKMMASKNSILPSTNSTAWFITLLIPGHTYIK